MTEVEITAVQEAAADKLEAERKAIEAKKDSTAEGAIRRALAGAVAERMTAFIYQDDTGELARQVVKDGRKLDECVGEIVKGVDRSRPAISDLDAYSKAIRYYLPEAVVRCTFRCVVPQEIDDDMAFLDLDTADQPETGGAQILDLYV